jgi:hypothetical protein
VATKGTPNDGLDAISAAAYVSGQLTLVAYTNAADSLGANTVAADLNQPTQANGYAPILLDGTWSSADGVTTYVHSTPTNPFWLALGAWSAPVTGAAIIHGSVCRHFMDFASPFSAAAGKKLEVDLNSVLG